MKRREFYLTDSERITLENAVMNHPKFHFRRRCEALLLCSNGELIEEVADLFGIRTRSIYTWMNRWRDMGIVGLGILKGRGLKSKLSQLTEQEVKELKKKVKAHCRSLRKMVAELSDLFEIEISRDMLRRFIKSLGYSWKRMRKSLKNKQTQEEYERKLRELKQLIELHKKGFIDLFFADESGFNMEGYVPYAWQPKGEYIQITPAKTPGTQVFGLMSLDNQLEAYTLKGSMNSKMVIAFINDFHKDRNTPTAIVIDNASIHHSKIFEQQMEKWKEEDLYIFHLPTYAPHLNPIEILWRMIKYQWIPYENLTSQEELDYELERILNEFGTEYTINFKELDDKVVSNIFT